MLQIQEEKQFMQAYFSKHVTKQNNYTSMHWKNKCSVLIHAFKCNIACVASQPRYLRNDNHWVLLQSPIQSLSLIKFSQIKAHPVLSSQITNHPILFSPTPYCFIIFPHHAYNNDNKLWINKLLLTLWVSDIFPVVHWRIRAKLLSIW